MAVVSDSSSLILFFFICLLSLSVISSSHSHPIDDAPETFIVHVSKSHKPSFFTSHHHWYSSIIKSLPPSPHPTKLLYSYEKSINGFSATLTAAQAAKLRDFAGVISVVPDQARQLHTTRTYRFLGLADGFGLWPNSDYAEDVFLDTGIWPERPSFSDSGLSAVPSGWKGTCESGPDFPASSCNKKIIGAKAFYNGYLAKLGGSIVGSKESKSPEIQKVMAPIRLPRLPELWFRTRVSSITLREKPEEWRPKPESPSTNLLELGMFRFGYLSSHGPSDSDGVHIISLSVGANGHSPPYYLDSIAVGAFGASQHGVLVSCSAGNSGPNPSTATNIAPWILTVGASTIDREFPADVVLGDGRVLNGVSLYAGEPLAADAKLSLIYAGDAGNRYCYSGSLIASKVAGKIVVCDRGGNARVEKGSAVKLAGGLALVLANTEDSGEELIADSHLIPATMVGQINVMIQRLLFCFGDCNWVIPCCSKVAAFSSRGPSSLTPEILKPDVIAPGVNILAGWTGSVGPTDLDIDPRRVEFNIISGTSMSCPHVSGLAALLRKAYPDWSPAAIKSALMTTAYNLDNSGETFDDLASGENQHLSFMEQDMLIPTKLSIRRISIFVKTPTRADICETTFNKVGALSSPGGLNYPSFSVVFDSHQGLVKYKRVVKNVGSEVDAVYQVTVSSPPGIEINVSPSKLVFSGVNQTQAYEVTFSTSVDYSKSAKFGSIEWTDGTHKTQKRKKHIQPWLVKN
ncbi:hypothetical protein F8388_021527 [Cannabis sativa]|uniref:Uncharacterized protein n=1 Tax=Cannabis sativa TaxID=3483 RepID=A0A7J6FE31_CANSA|nr:hypothetical protein F8388_021527 [Cannabis sativa]